MKNIIIVTNWKSFKNPGEAKEWINQFNSLAKNLNLLNKPQIILCTPFIDLPILKEELSENNFLNLTLASQNISSFGDGAYTGEISASMLKDQVSYIMIGHSERRKIFLETDEIVNQKISQSQKAGLKTIVCVSDISQAKSVKKIIADYHDLILYEPLFAIGTGISDSPENTNQIIGKIKQTLPSAKVIYGGSINAENVNSFIKQPEISGVAVGKASLDPVSFINIIKNAVN